MLVYLSVVLAIAFSYSALRLAFTFEPRRQKPGERSPAPFSWAPPFCDALHLDGRNNVRSFPGRGRFEALPNRFNIWHCRHYHRYCDHPCSRNAVVVALAQANMKLVSVGRAASLGGLAMSIAHEINQPLGALVNSASACLR